MREDIGIEEAVRLLSSSAIADAKLVPSALKWESPILVLKNDSCSIEITPGDQCCCEYLYLHTDDDLGSMCGERIVSMETTKVEEAAHGEDAVHEVSFLKIQTDKSSYTIGSHNEHNGYYGGCEFYFFPQEEVQP